MNVALLIHSLTVFAPQQQ